MIHEGLMVQLAKRHIQLNYAEYQVSCCLAILCEIALIVRKYKLQNSEIYLIAYSLMLLTVSIFLVLLIINKIRKNNILDVVVIYKYFLIVFAIAWSVAVSILDVQMGNSPILYLSFIIFLGGLTVVNPILYAILICISTYILGYYTNLVSVSTTNEMFNYLTFIGMAIVLSVKNYSMSKREYFSNKEIKKLVYIDNLTQIKNRRALEEEFFKLTENKASGWIGILDMDDFKKINDTLGHEEGDHALVYLAGLLKEEFEDSVYRFAGDEFVFYTNSTIKEIEMKIKRINRKLKSKWNGINVKISCGICFKHKRTDAKETLNNADFALYQAKEAGKGQVRYFKI